MLISGQMTALGKEAGSGMEPPRKIAVVSINLPAFPDAAKEAAARMKGLRVDLFGLGSGRLPGIDGVDLGAYDLVLIEHEGTKMLSFASQFEKAKARTKVLVIPSRSRGASYGLITGNLDPAQYPDAVRYWENGSADNYERLFDYLAAKVLGVERRVRPPVLIPDLAIYHPAAQDSFPDLASYQAWMRTRLPDADSRPRIGILFYRHVVLARISGVIDALIAEVERQGGMPVAVWRSGSENLLSSIAPAPALDAVISCVNPIVVGSGEGGVAEAKRLDAPLLGCSTDYFRSPQQWRESVGGFAPAQTGNLALSELEGAFEPMMLGGRIFASDGSAHNEPMADQIRWRVARAMKWAALRRKPNHEKKIVIVYHSEDAGKADLGGDPDTYLDVQGSLAVLLRRLRDEGYDTGAGPLPDSATIARMMVEQGRNIGVWDKADLSRRVAEGSAFLVSESQYRRWYAALPADARAMQEKIWGPPPGRLMVYQGPEGERAFVIPALRFGKIVIAPQPVWGLLQDDKVLENLGALPPHHQYAAFYLWMQHGYQADAFLPMWTQLSLMPGKLEGPAQSDWAGLLIGNLPHIRPLPLHGAGGAANKRRVNALTLGFMPAFHQGGLSPPLKAIRTDIAAWHTSADAAKRAALIEEMKRAATANGIDRGLDTPLAEMSDDALVVALALWLDQTEKAIIPRGGAVLGVAPRPEVTAMMVQAMVAAEGAKLTRDDVAAIISGAPPIGTDNALANHVRDYAARVAATPKELDAIIASLSGHYIEPGPIQDAIRNPDAVPGGRNPYTLNVKALPTPEAEASGRRLAEQMLTDAMKKRGKLPRKVAFILWSVETAQNEGVNEAAMLHLLGARFVRGTRGDVTDVALIDRKELGRPRVDIMATASGLYRDHFLHLLNLISKAVRLASEAEEEDNPVRAATQQQEAALIARGIAPDAARKSALRRLFSEAPGAYSPSTQFAVKAGPQWTDERLSSLYAGRLSFSYGEGDEGINDSDAFLAGLETVDAAVFSRSSNALGLLDNPMSAAYLGGLGMAVRENTGRQIDNYIVNMRDPASPRVETLERFFGQDLQSRYFNPEWIRGMQESGYNGARYFSGLADNMMLWDVTTPDLVQDADWQAINDIYVKDRYELGLKDYFDRTNPYARQQMLETMVRAIDRGSWKADVATKQALEKELAQSIADHGASGARPYRALAAGEGAVMEGSAPSPSPLRAGRRPVINSRSKSRQSAASHHDAPSHRQTAGGGHQTPGGLQTVTGLKMEDVQRPAAVIQKGHAEPVRSRLILLALCMMGLIGAGVGWKNRW